jgi:hypothetical protein
MMNEKIWCSQVTANIQGAIASLIDDELNLNSIAPTLKTEPQEMIEGFVLEVGE